jgi:RNA polymerase sigma-70 factor (ECF subfamily)
MMSPELLGRLMDDHAGALVLYARQWCHTPEDVVQEAFLKLSAMKSTPAAVVPWLFRVVRHGAISAARRARRRKIHEQARAAQISTWFKPVPPGALDPESARDALVALPDEEREVIVAHLWGGLTFQQIAEIMGSSHSSVHRWYVTGLSHLRERLGVSCSISRTNNR